MLLLRSGADPDPRSGYGLTPLALAAQAGHTEIMELLLQKGETLLCRKRRLRAGGSANVSSI